jgi:hypothetical protein
MITEEAVKRKRGRPRKNVIPVVEAPIEVTKRPRGRPRKVTQLIVPAPVQEEVLPTKRKRGRPSKNSGAQLTVRNSTSGRKDYIIVSLEDLEFWAETTNRDIFKQTVTDYNKAKKAKATPEVRWYKDRIELV